MKEVDGVLREAAILSVAWVGPDGGVMADIAVGRVYGDRKGRFPDGHYIQTSPILEGPDEDGVIRTANSSYVLVMGSTH